MLTAAYEKLCDMMTDERKVHLPDGLVGTLLFGCDAENNTWHVYAERGKIVQILYKDGRLVAPVVREDAMPFDAVIANKRVYPQHSSYVFCKKLIEVGCRVPFTDYEEDRVARWFPREDDLLPFNKAA